MAIPDRLLAELASRRRVVADGGGKDKQGQRRASGQMTARDRLDALFAAGSFQEIGAHVAHAGRHFGIDKKTLPADGVIVGTGYVDGRLAVGISQDFTVAAGTLGKMHAAKMVEMMRYALNIGCPVVAFKDSGGARIQEGVDALSGYGRVFYHNVLLSGVVPQIAIIAGPCAGGAAYSPALMDFVIMTRSHGQMFITGPQVIKAVTGRETSVEEIGGADVHASVSGNVHFVAEDDADAVRIARRLLSFLPSNNTEDPPHRPWTEMAIDDDIGMNELVPEETNEPLDVRRVIRRLVDDGDFLEIHAAFAPNLVVGLARLQGMVVGLVANQSIEKAGTLDIDASDKGARFVRLCNIYHIPLITLVDVPGFLPGVEEERGGIIRHGAKMLFAYASATVPKITVILRKAYGGSYLAMCSQEMGADFVYAWPGAEIAVMGAEGAVNILYRKELDQAEDRRAKAAELAAEYRERFSSPYLAAAQGYVSDVIRPSETRGTVALALRKSLSKREVRPPKKHGAIPL